MPQGDDVPLPAGLPGCPGPTIRNGLNLTCETTAAASDQQVRREGSGGAGSCTDGMDNDGDGDTDENDSTCFEAPIITGHADWDVVELDFKRFDDPPEAALEDRVIDDPLTLEDFDEQLRLLNQADLAVSVTTSPESVEIGDDLVYMIDITNPGPNPKSNVLARQFLDPTTTLVSHSPDCVETSAGELECGIGALRLNGSTSFGVTVATGECVAGTPATVTYRSVVDNLAGVDPDLTNNMVEVSVTPVDTTPPTIESATSDNSKLWPPNHKMIPVTLEVVAVDSCTAAPRCSITSVVSNEAVLGKGSGKTSPDWLITGDLTVSLRAERAGKGSGRIYTVTVECTDASSNISRETASVNVPHS
jgi:uncharacterized repeat protein (TIGR01451 family)